MHNASLGAIVSALGALCLLGLLGFTARRRLIISATGVTELSRLLVDLILPAGLFHAMFSQYSRERIGDLWHTGVFVIGMVATGMIAGLVLSRLVGSRMPRGPLLCLSSMHNNVYLPLPVAMAVLAPADAAVAQFHIGCVLLFFSPILWSLGVVLIAGAKAQGPVLRQVFVRAFNPPFLAALTGLLAKELFLSADLQMPQVVTTFTKMCLDATAPLTTVVLGCVLAEAEWSKAFEPAGVISASVAKLVIVPAVVLVAIRMHGGLHPIFAFSMMLQAASPPATNLILIARRFDGNSSLIAVGQFVSYLVAILTIPLWLLALRP